MVSCIQVGLTELCTSTSSALSVAHLGGNGRAVDFTSGDSFL